MIQSGGTVHYLDPYSGERKLRLSEMVVITSYSIHYTKLYDIIGDRNRRGKIQESTLKVPGNVEIVPV